MNDLPKGQSGEISRVFNKPGIYRLERPGMEPAEVITYPENSQTLSEGTTQADALVRMGYQYAGPAPTVEELRAAETKAVKEQEAKEAEAKAAKSEKTK